MKEYLFLELNSSECNLQDLLRECTQFKQIHFYLHDFQKDKQILDTLGPHLDSELFLYCFSENEYLYALKNNITPHLCWLNESIQGVSWIDTLLINNKKEVVNHEFFWMLEEKFVHQLKDLEIIEIAQKLQSYNIPVCFNVSKFFNKTNINFVDIQSFIKKMHCHFNNPLYFKECDNIHYVHGNYYLNNNLELQPLLMGFFGDIVSADIKIDFINLKNMNKNNECLNCDLHENCTTNKVGYFMNKYNAIQCWGPKLMRFNMPVIIQAVSDNKAGV